MKLKRPLRTAGLALAFLSTLAAFHAPSTFAASHTWSGAVNGYFSNAGNWSSGGVPTLAETNNLVFPAGVTRTTVTNDIGALKVAAFSFSGSNYVVRGASAFTVEPALLNILCSGGSNTIESAMSFLSGAAISVGEADTMVLAGMVSGTGGLTKFGVGELHLKGTASNPLTGSLDVYSGELHFAKTGGATPYGGNSISIGSTNVSDPTQLFLHANNQIPDGADLTILPSGALLLNGFSDIVNSVAMHSGTVDTGGGILGVGSALNLSPRHVSGLTYESPTLQGTLEFHGATCTISVSSNACDLEANIVENGTVTALNKTGAGELRLKGGGNFTGALNINQGTVIAYTANSLGSVAGGTTVASGATLEFRPGYISSEPLTLTGLGEGAQGALRLFGGSMTHLGPISITGEAAVGVTTAGDVFDLSGVISGSGGIRKVGDGHLRFNGASANTFSAASMVARGKLTLNKNANVRAIGSVTVTNGAELALDSLEQIDNGGTLSLHAGAVFNMAGFNESVGGLNLGGNHVLDTGSATLTLLGLLYAGPPYTTNFVNTRATIRGNLSLGGGTRPMQDGGCPIVLDCAISDGAGVGGIHLQDGYLYLVRSNSFTGPVFVDGYCTISNNFAFGAASGGVFATNAPGNGSTILLAAPTVSVTNETLTCWSGLELYGQGTNTWNGPILTASNYFRTFAPPGAELTLGGHVSGAGSLHADGQGLLRLMQSNSYAGLTLISGGTIWNSTVAIRHPHSLGTSAQGTQVGEGATLRLELPNGAEVSGESLLYEYNGWTDNSNNWLIVAGAVSNTWSAPVTINIPVRVNVLDPDATLNLVAAIGGSGALEKTGPGKLILAGANPNTYPGETTATDGTLRLNKPNGVQAVSNLTVRFPAWIEWGADEQIADTATLQLFDCESSFGHNETITRLVIQDTYLASGAGALTLLGDIEAPSYGNSFDSYCSLSGSLRLAPGAHHIFNTNTSPWAGGVYLQIHSSIHETSASAGLIMTNLTVFLRGSNSFTGPVVVDDASLHLLHPGALGTPAQGTLLTNSGNLDLAMPSGSVVSGESLVIAPPAPDALYPSTLSMNGEYTNTWAGPIVLQGSNQFRITVGSKLTVDGVVSGPGPLYVEAAAELVLSGNQPNTFGDLVFGGESGLCLVRLAKPAGVHAFTGDLHLTGATFPSYTNTVILEAPGQFPPQSTAHVGLGSPYAALNLNGHAATLKRLLGAGQVQIGAGTLTLSNSLAQYSDFSGILQSAPGGTLIHQGLGTQRGGTFALSGAAFLQSGTMYFDGGYIGSLDISAGAILDMYSQEAHFGSLSGAGRIITSSGVMYVGANDNSTTFAGVIEGFSSTNLIKVGTGALTLTGANTDTGKTLVRNGTLLVNGALAGPVHVQSIGLPNVATLGGAGQVGNVTITGLNSRVAPGATTNTPSYGRLRVGSFTLGPDAAYRCELGGTNAGVDLDQIDASGTASLSGGFADFTAFGAGAVSNRYAVVKSTAPVSGNFLNDPEGDYIFPAAGRFMIITYLTAGGQEVALIEQQGSPIGNFGVTGITQLTNGHISLVGTGAPSAAYFILANTNLSSTNWVEIGNATGHAFDGTFSFTDTNAAVFPQRFYRFRLQ